MIEESATLLRIEKLRLRKGVTLAELSEKTGFMQGYLSKMENTAKTSPVSTLIALTKCLDTILSNIFGEKELLVEEGDCLYFDASIPHNGLCNGKKKRNAS